MKAVFAWLRDRPDVADARIGGWGVSYGGGAAWNSLAADVPWAALEISISWTDLRQALVPQGLAKTGVIAGFLGALDPKRVDPEVLAMRDAAFARQPRDRQAASPPRARRSRRSRASRRRSSSCRAAATSRSGSTRRCAPIARSRGPKQLWIGLNGHAPSSGIAADTPAMLAEGARWFDRFLRGDTAPPLAKPVAISPERWRGQPRPVRRAAEGRRAAVPSARPARGASDRAGRPLPAPGSRGRAPARGLRLPDRPGDGEGDRAAGRGSSPCSAPGRPPARRSSSPAAACRPGRGARTYRIALADQATFLPRGSRLTLTIGSSSLAQSPAQPPLPRPAVRVDRAARRRPAAPSRFPELATPVSR